MPEIVSHFVNAKQIEPTSFEQSVPSDITDMINEIVHKSGQLSAKLAPHTATKLASAIRLMNTYYSNLIEGHRTLPVDIERALNSDFDQDFAQRNLQLEARTHFKLQEEIDNLYTQGSLPEPSSKKFILELHHKFYKDAPTSMLQIGTGQRGFQMTPGKWRSQKTHDVYVGKHLPPASGYVEAFMDYFEEKFKLTNMDMHSKIIAIAISHHRFSFIHPFPDGNGRISRLMSHAMIAKAGIGSTGLWSISRGLARGLDSHSEYKLMLSHADSHSSQNFRTKNHLSIEALQSFTVWFLAVCLDQIEFMTELFDLSSLTNRIKQFVRQSEGLKNEATFLIEEAFIRGEFERGAATRLTGLPERSARRVLKSLIDIGLLESNTPKGPVSLKFPVSALEIFFPRLFPTLQ